MSSSQGIALRAIGHKQDGVTSLQNDITARHVGDGDKSNETEEPQLVSSASVNGSEGVASESTHITASQARVHRWKSRMHFAALCYSYFLEGWNDGSLGLCYPGSSNTTMCVSALYMHTTTDTLSLG